MGYVKLADPNGSISYDRLHEIFSSYGGIETINIPYRRRTAFVTMETKKGADKARAEARKNNPEIQICDLAFPRRDDRDDERRPYGRGNSHYNRYKNRTNSWKSRENDRYSSEDNRRNRKRRKSRSSKDFQAFNNGDKKHPIKSSESSTLSSQAPSFSSANSYPADANQLGQQFAQMNLNQQFPVNYENTQNLLAMSQMDPMQQAMYNQYLLGLYGNMPMVSPTASMDAQTQPYDPTVDAQLFQQMYDAQNMFQFYQPPHPLVLPFPQYSENPYGPVQFQDPSATDIAEEVQGGDNNSGGA